VCSENETLLDKIQINVHNSGQDNCAVSTVSAGSAESTGAAGKIFQRKVGPEVPNFSGPFERMEMHLDE